MIIYIPSILFLNFQIMTHTELNLPQKGEIRDQSNPLWAQIMISLWPTIPFVKYYLYTINYLVYLHHKITLELELGVDSTVVKTINITASSLHYTNVNYYQAKICG